MAGHRGAGFSVLIVPKVTVGIVDKTGRLRGQGGRQRALRRGPAGQPHQHHRPHLTGLFETAFQVIPGIGALPAELSYQQNGLMFGNRLIRETGNVVFQDPAFRTDLINFIHNCTTYDLIDGTLDPATFSTSDDVWPLMASPNPARFSTDQPRAAVSASTPAPTSTRASTGDCQPRSLASRGDSPSSSTRRCPAPPRQPSSPGRSSRPISRTTSPPPPPPLPTSSGRTRCSMRSRTPARSSARRSMIRRPWCWPSAAPAVAQQNAAWLNYGKVAEQALPVFRNVVEAVTYAMFPLFVPLLLLTSGRETMMAFRGYAAVLIWIQLWPPLYAILNYMASIYAAYDLAARSDLAPAPGAGLQTARRSIRARSRARPSSATWRSASPSSPGRP